MLCPTVDEGKGEFSADVELALQDGVHAGDEPVFIVTVVWQHNASTVKTVEWKLINYHGSKLFQK